MAAEFHRDSEQREQREQREHEKSTSFLLLLRPRGLLRGRAGAHRGAAGADGLCKVKENGTVSLSLSLSFLRAGEKEEEGREREREREERESNEEQSVALSFLFPFGKRRQLETVSQSPFLPQNAPRMLGKAALCA